MKRSSINLLMFIILLCLAIVTVGCKKGESQTNSQTKEKAREYAKTQIYEAYKLSGLDKIDKDYVEGNIFNNADLNVFYLDRNFNLDFISDNIQYINNSGEVTIPNEEDVQYLVDGDIKYIIVSCTLTIGYSYQYVNESFVIMDAYLNETFEYSFKIKVNQKPVPPLPPVFHDNEVLRPEQIDKSKPVEVKFYHAMGQDKQAIIQSIIDRFQVEMKDQYGVDVTVIQSSQGDYDTLRKTIAAEIAANEPPTIAQTYPYFLPSYLKANAVRKLDDFVTDKDYGLAGTEADSYGYLDKFWAEGRSYDKAGTLYSLPFNKSTELMYYNKTLFEKYGWDVPQTWDQVVEVTKKWMETTEYKEIRNKNLKAAGLAIDSERNAFITLIKQWGGEYTDFDSQGNGVYKFVNAEAEQALTWLYDQFQADYVASTTFFGTKYSSDAFKNGQCIMTTGSSAGAKYNMDMTGKFVTGVAPYPQHDLSNKQVIQQGTNVTLFKCDDAQEELFGWLFMKYLTTDFESCKEWTLKSGYFPIRKDVVKDPEYQDYVNQVKRDAQGHEKYTYNPIAEAVRIGLLQADYFYTILAFPGSSRAVKEGEYTIQLLLYGDKYNGNVRQALEEALTRISND